MTMVVWPSSKKERETALQQVGRAVLRLDEALVEELVAEGQAADYSRKEHCQRQQGQRVRRAHRDVRFAR